MPSKPWHSIHIDLCGPFPTGESLLVCVDACSRWPEVEIIRTTSSEVIIRCLQKSFAKHGLPEQVTSDNGSNLISKEIEDYFSSHGIRHRKITPYWPKANAMVERFNRTVEKAEDWKKELNTFLLNYRATPHAMTGVSSAEIMFERDIRTKLPEFSDSEKSAVLNDALARDLRHKAKMKQHSDERDRSTPSNVVEGDTVLLKLPKTNKMSTTFDPNPYRVVQRQGSSVYLKRGQEPTIMRNVSWTRKMTAQAIRIGNLLMTKTTRTVSTNNLSSTSLHLLSIRDQRGPADPQLECRTS